MLVGQTLGLFKESHLFSKENFLK